MSSTEPNIGDIIRERFVLERQLGAGGMGRVFKALDLLRQEARDREPYVAIKFVSDAFRSQPISFVALQREAKKAQKLNHPNIVRVFDFDRDGHLIFIVMEYLSGDSLDKFTKNTINEGMSSEDVLRILEPVSIALSFAHDNGIVHLDIKPSNIFLTEDGTVKVIDFGISRAVRTTDDRDQETVFDPRKYGALTSAYASPEVIDGLEPDPRADVYSLAVVTYELLTGRHPFDRESSVKARASKYEPARVRALTRSQWAALQTALMFERGKRTPTVARFIEGLRGRGQTRGHRKRAAALLLVAFVFGVAGSYAIYQLRSQSSSLDAESGDEAGDQPPLMLESQKPPAAQTSLAPALPSRPDSGVTRGEAPDDQTENAATEAMVSSVAMQAPCAALTTLLINGTVYLEGYVGDEQTAESLMSSFKEAPGVRDVNTDRVRQIPSAYCDVLEVYQQPIEINIKNNSDIIIEPHADYDDFFIGDELVLLLRNSFESSYIYVDYFSMDGSVVHMLPNAATGLSRVVASGEMQLGAGAVGNWIIGEPVGTEMIAILASPVPLFSEERPEVERSKTYLSDLRAAFEVLRLEGSADDGPAANILVITTRERS